jgi:RHS repeat-associated protein
MGCKRLNTDFFTFLEIVHSKKSASEEKKRINYYPFGLQHKGYNNVVSANANSVAQKFGYNGKELNEELGLEWMDFGARNYDASLGRWMNIDPMGELLMSHSPFNYAFNNPVYFDDPTGMLPQGYSTNSDYYITDYYDDGTGTVIYDPNVHGPDDVPSGATYIGPTYTDPTTGTFWDENGKPHQSDQVLDEVVVNANTSSSNNNDKLLHIWGIGTGLQGNGQTGSGVSIDYDEISFGRGRTNSGKSHWKKLIQWINGLIGRTNKIIDKTVKPNETTMENKVEEEGKNVPKKIQDSVEFHFQNYKTIYERGAARRSSLNANITRMKIKNNPDIIESLKKLQKNKKDSVQKVVDNHNN